ncbi:MAG: hypothetical protein ACRC7O_00745 [Fimbriiglobus sp.]
MSSQQHPPPNPNRVRAGTANRRLRGPLTAAGRERLRETALAHQPWRAATGPTSAAGKAVAAANGKVRQRGPVSVRQARRAAATVAELCDVLAAARALARQRP